MLVDSVVSVLESMASSVKCGHAVLLEGVTGSGKTTLVEYMAEKMKKKLVKMNLGDQMDAKVWKVEFHQFIVFFGKIVFLHNIIISSQSLAITAAQKSQGGLYGGMV